METQQQEDDAVANPQPEDTSRLVLSDASEFVRKLGESAAASAVDDDSVPKIVKRTGLGVWAMK